MTRLDVWWWGLSCWVVSCVGSTKQKMMVHFLAILLYSYDNFFNEMIQTGRKPVLLSAIFALFIFWGPLTTKLGTCGFLSEPQISQNHSRNLIRPSFCQYTNKQFDNLLKNLKYNFQFKGLSHTAEAIYSVGGKNKFSENRWRWSMKINEAPR